MHEWDDWPPRDAAHHALVIVVWVLAALMVLGGAYVIVMWIHDTVLAPLPYRDPAPPTT